MNSESLFERSLKVAPGGVHSPVRSFQGMGRSPVFFKDAEGAHLISVEGKKYIDFCMSFGPHLLGHRDPDVQEEVIRAIESAWSFSACEPYSLELGEFIQSHLCWMEKLRFVNSGTEAVMSALRVARAATGREKVLKFDGCYHGHVDHMLVQSGSGLAGQADSSSAGVGATLAGMTLVSGLDDIESVERIFNEHGKDISAVIIEPLPANYGLLIQSEQFLFEVMEVAKKHGALVIFDEVISGFRVALGGMIERLKKASDLVTYGKVIGGGFPVGCYGGREDLMAMVAPSGRVYQAGTLSGSPVGMRAGLASLKKAHLVNLYSKLELRTGQFVQKMNQLFQKYNADMEAISMGSLFWIHQKSDQALRRPDQIPSHHKENFKPFFNYLLDHGVYLAPNAFEVGFVSWAHSEDILAEVLQVIESYLSQQASQ